MTTSKQVYNVAKAHLGHSGSHARSFCGLGGGQPYCCAYVAMCMHKSGGAKLFYGGKKCTYCPAAIKWCKANLAEIPFYLAMPMDFIFFDWQPNGNPDHIGFVLEKISTNKIKTLEGNTSGGIVTTKTRSGYVQGIFRPHYMPDKKLTKGKVIVDGDFGYHSIYMLQVALGLKPDGILGKATVKALQKKAGTAADGSWGRNTSKKVQKMVGTAVDGEFGPNSVKALQKWINKVNYPSTKKTPKRPKTEPKETKTVSQPSTEPKTSAKTKTEKIIDAINILAWPYGTAEKKWKYSTGSPRNTCKTAMKKYGYKNKVAWSDCGYCVNTAIRLALGIKIKVLTRVKAKFPVNSGFQTIYKGGTIPDGLLKPGDIIRYKKTKGSQHVMFYYGNGHIAEGGRRTRFFVIRKDEKKYNKPNVRHKTIEVLRIREEGDEHGA